MVKADGFSGFSLHLSMQWSLTLYRIQLAKDSSR